jgi:hypothetical protein
MGLAPKGETNDFHGISCERYEVKVPGHGTMSLWLSNDPTLPPFHLLTHQPPDPGHREWDDRIAALLRKENRFPFLAILKGEAGDTLARWEVTAYRPRLAPDTPADLFAVPQEFDRSER